MIIVYDRHDSTQRMKENNLYYFITTYQIINDYDRIAKGYEKEEAEYLEYKDFIIYFDYSNGYYD